MTFLALQDGSGLLLQDGSGILLLASSGDEYGRCALTFAALCGVALGVDSLAITYSVVDTDTLEAT